MKKSLIRHTQSDPELTKGSKPLSEKSSPSAKATADKSETKTSGQQSAVSVKKEKLTASRLPLSASVPQTMDELLATSDYSLKVYKKGDVVEGKIASITGKEVLIDVAGKTEAIIGEKEWDQVKTFVSELKPGDKITGVVISAENDRGQLVISIRRAGSDYRWQKMERLLKSGEPLTVRGVEINKGGLIVEAEGLRGFVPTSQLSMENQAQIQKMINKSFQSIVIEVSKEQNRLIFSERQISATADLAKKLEEVRSKVKTGETYKGKVSAIMNYGVFVNLSNGADGLVHISEVSWNKVDDLGSIFTVGQEVEVLVLGIGENDGKLNLSVKQLQPDPWLKLADKYKPDQQIVGKVTKLTSYGAFVELEPEVEGLIRTSKIPPSMELNPGDKVSCIVESVDLPAHKIALVPVLTEKPVGYK